MSGHVMLIFTVKKAFSITVLKVKLKFLSVIPIPLNSLYGRNNNPILLAAASIAFLPFLTLLLAPFLITQQSNAFPR